MDFDIAMPLTLFAVTIVAMFLNKKVGEKLKGVLQEREFRTRDAVLLVASLAIVVTVVVFVPQWAIMTVFLFSYSMLLFIFSYLFSDQRKDRAGLFLTAFVVVGFVAGGARLFVFENIDNAFYGALTFSGFSAFAFAALVYEMRRSERRERWYLAVLPPALFICLYLFFSPTPAWFPYLLNTYGVIFAVLIILYMSSLFTWKTTLIFVGLLTVMDTILVLFTGTMVSAARSISALKLPVLISLPTVPEILFEGNRLYMSLGLGDFFFAGLLTIQMLKRYGKKIAILAATTMTISFAIFEAYILNFEVRAFPGTVMVICGWIPIAIAAEIARKPSHPSDDSTKTY
jgi:hypothetical protein